MITNWGRMSGLLMPTDWGHVFGMRAIYNIIATDGMSSITWCTMTGQRSVATIRLSENSQLWEKPSIEL